MFGEETLATAVLGTAPVVGVALLGGALSPCDSMGCTTDYNSNKHNREVLDVLMQNVNKHIKKIQGQPEE
jgi:hypothetical protein